MAKQQVPPTVADFVAMLREVRSESDRGAVLILGQWVDDGLAELLRSVVVEEKKLSDDLFGVDRPLGTFSSRINVAYAFGLLSKKYFDDLHSMRAIRNLFAHDRGSVTFALQSINDRCENFSLVKEYLAHVSNPLKTSREKFMMVSFFLLGYCLTKATRVARFGLADGDDQKIMGHIIDTMAAAVVHVTGQPIP